MTGNRQTARCASRLSALMALLAGAVLGLASPAVVADESGVSFWAPGTYGSLAAAPTTPGWSLGLVYYHGSVDASGSKEFPVSGKVTAGLAAKPDILFLSPAYVFSDPVLGGQAAVSVTGVYGRAEVSVNATLTGPSGGILSGSTSDSLTAFGDLYPSASLRWNRGNHNYLGYLMLGVPVGSYQVGRLANLGINHWSVDTGGGYTYFNQKNGREFSALAGLTYNFENPDTDYRNGVDAHLDWGASQFLSAQWHIGLVGYFYHQVTGDSGAGARLGDFKSRVSGIGPQVGYLFPLGGRQAYVNFKGYHEFDAENRPDGWNVWLTLSLPLGSGK
jgi:hypothetical protein